MKADTPNESMAALRQRLNSETGKITWPELQRHFARGVVLKVSADLDLVEVAASMAADDSGKVAEWLRQGGIATADSADARDWQARQPCFWAVVTAPWVLIQEIAATAG